MDSDGCVLSKRLHSFSWNHHRSTFFKTVYDLRSQEMFCDITLACDGVMFPAHRLVLAMCSEYFHEILTKFPCQQQMVMLVPNVAATDLNAILKYVYLGEIQVSKSTLPSLLKAGQTLKIKGLCVANTAPNFGQKINEKEEQDVDGSGASDSVPTAMTPTAIVDENETSQDSVTSMQSQQQKRKKTTKHKSKHKKTTAAAAATTTTNNNDKDTFPQVEVFIDDDDEDGTRDDAKYDRKQRLDDEDGSMRDVWFEDDDDKYLDPLNVPLLSPAPLTFDNPDSPSMESSGGGPLPLEVSLTTEEDQLDTKTNTTPTITTTTNSTGYNTGITSPNPAAIAAAAVATFGTNPSTRYTREQKLQIVQEYYIHGPVRTAKLMSQRLGRRMNESSVRSIVRSWERHSGGRMSLPGRNIYDAERELQAFY